MQSNDITNALHLFVAFKSYISAVFVYDVGSRISSKYIQYLGRATERGMFYKNLI